MSLDDLVNVTIEADTTSPTRPGFGTILCLVGKVPSLFPANATVTIKSLTDMTDAGFSSSDPAYKLVSKIFSQKTRPNQVKLWKRSLAPVVMSVDLKVLQAASGVVLAVSVNGVDYSITLDGTTGATTTTAATALAAAIDDDTGLDVTHSTDTVTIALHTASAGDTDGLLFQVKNWNGNLAFKNQTAYATSAGSHTIADDLAAALVADSDWYGVALDSLSKTEITDAAAWVESNKRLMVVHTNDSECKDSAVSTDVMSAIKTSGAVRTAVLYNGNDTYSYAGSAWMGGRFPFQPGSYTWAFKSLGAVSPDALTPTEQGNIDAKKGNTYTKIAGVSITLKGITGGGEFIDVTQFIDWLRSEIQVRVYGRLVNLPKVPFTDLGVDIVLNEVLGALQAGVRAGGLDPGDGKDIPAPSASAPKVADVSTLDRANRHLPNVKFGGKLAGAIHDLDINGTLTV